MSPAVAVITRTKDRPLLLGRAFSSVLNQTFRDWQLVLVNDGGDPAPVDALVRANQAAFAGRVQVIHHPRSLGMEAASNAGLKSSDSEFCIIHDDDDAWHPDFLSETVAFLREQAGGSTRGVIAHSIKVEEVIEGSSVRIISREPFNTFLKSISLFKMCAANHFPPISFLYRRAVHDEIGYFRADLPVLGDWEFNIRFLQKYDIGIVAKPLAYYHHRKSIKSGIYGNTIIADVSKHDRYDAMIRNELLRKDLEGGRFGIGTIVNLAKSTADLEGVLHHWFREQLFIYVKDRIYNSAKKLGLIGRR